MLLLYLVYVRGVGFEGLGTMVIVAGEQVETKAQVTRQSDASVLVPNETQQSRLGIYGATEVKNQSAQEDDRGGVVSSL